GIAAMAAVEDGLLTLDEKVADTITEWKGDPRKGQITIRQLLTLSSGLDPGANLSGAAADCGQHEAGAGRRGHRGPWDDVQVRAEPLLRVHRGAQEKAGDQRAGEDARGVPAATRAGSLGDHARGLDQGPRGDHQP